MDRNHRQDRHSKLCLLFQDPENQRLLTSWLSDQYNIITTLPEPAAAASVDLCIFDQGSLDRHHSDLEALKQAADPAYLPFLLIIRTDQNAAEKVQATSDLIDEVVTIPTQKSTLHTLITRLLKRRRQSLELSDQLEYREQLFEEIFNSSNDAILIIDPETDSIREFNPQAANMLGYTRDELLSQSTFDIHPDDTAVFQSFLATVRDEGQGRTTALTFHTKDDQRVEVEISASSIEIDGRTHVLANIRDVTQQREQARILSSLHDVTADLMAASTPQEVAEITANAAEAVFNYDVAGVRLLDDETRTLPLIATTSKTRDLLGDTLDPYEAGEGLVGRVFQQQEPVIIEDLSIEDTPIDYGQIRSAMCFPLGSHGVLSIGATETAGFDEVEFEVTQTLATETTAALTRTKREQALREKHEYLTQLFENSTDCIADVELDNTEAIIRDVNPTFEAVFGYAADDIKGKLLQDLIVPPDRTDESRAILRQARSGNRVEIESKRETRTGRRDFIVRVVPIEQDARVIGAYIVYTDITDRKRQTQQLQVLNRVLRHNLRNKLNVLIGQIDQLASLSSDEQSNEVQQQSMRTIDDVLNLSKTAQELSNDTDSDTNRDPTFLPDLAEHIAEDVHEQYQHAEVTTTVSSQVWIAGTIQLETVLRELCENAIEHHDQEHPSVEIRVVKRDDRPGWVELSVADDGPGIPEHEREVLRKGEETPLQHGSGLGLWTVNWIVNAAGGELSITDSEPRGTTVTLTLPTINPETYSASTTELTSTNE